MVDRVEIVEVYVPRRLEYLSGLYAWLRRELENAPSRALFRGFSLYEVSGAYAGERTYTEQTLVIRLIFELSDDERIRALHELRVDEIADAISQITENREEELWLVRTPALLTKRAQRRLIHATGL